MHQVGQKVMLGSTYSECVIATRKNNGIWVGKFGFDTIKNVKSFKASI